MKGNAMYCLWAPTGLTCSHVNASRVQTGRQVNAACSVQLNNSTCFPMRNTVMYAELAAHPFACVTQHVMTPCTTLARLLGLLKIPHTKFGHCAAYHTHSSWTRRPSWSSHTAAYLPWPFGEEKSRCRHRMMAPTLGDSDCGGEGSGRVMRSMTPAHSL